MSNPQIDIARVVEEVLTELKVRGGRVDETRADEQPAAYGSDEQPAAPGDLVLSCRVVTMSDVAGRLDAARRLVVPARALVTPAVRDELHRRNVSLAYLRAAKAQAAGAVRLVLVTVGGFEATLLVEALASEGIEVEPRTLDCVIAATDQLAAELARADTLGVLLTRHTAAGVCLANRQHGVRAVSGADTAAVAAAAGAVGANLLLLDPSAAGLFQLKQVITEFCRGGVRACPEVLRERLA